MHALTLFPVINMALTQIFHSHIAQMFASGIAVYYILLCILHRFMSYACADFYGSLLKEHGTRKTLALLVFVIGICTTLISSPACATAFMASSVIIGNNSKGPMAMDAKICLGSRAVLWAAELPLLGETRFYLVHHALSLTSLFIIMSKNLSLRPLYLIYAGLITELFSSSRAFVRGSGLHQTHSKLFARLTNTNAFAIIFARLLPALYILYNELSYLVFSDNLGLAYFCCVVFYAVFVTYMTYKLLAGNGHVSFHSAQPAYLLFTSGNQTQRISVFSLLLATAMVTAKLSTAMLYEVAHKGPLPKGEMVSLVTIGFGTVILGLLGAKLMNSTFSLSSNRALRLRKNSDTLSLAAAGQQGVPCRFFPRFNGISIQGAILFSGIWLFGNSLLGLRVNNRILFGAAGVSLALGEALGRIGCYFAGCCGSERWERFPNVQLLSATLNIVIYVTRILALDKNGTSSIFEAGVEAVLANGVIRLVLNPFRSDAAESILSPASMFATAQVMFASAMLTLEQTAAGTNPTAAVLTSIGLVSRNMLMCRIAIFLWAMIATQLQKWSSIRFMRSEHAVYAFSAMILVLVVKRDAGGPVEPGKYPFLGQERLLVITNPALWCSVAVTAALPVILLN